MHCDGDGCRAPERMRPAERSCRRAPPNNTSFKPLQRGGNHEKRFADVSPGPKFHNGGHLTSLGGFTFRISRSPNLRPDPDTKRRARKVPLPPPPSRGPAEAPEGPPSASAETTSTSKAESQPRRSPPTARPQYKAPVGSSALWGRSHKRWHQGESADAMGQWVTAGHIHGVVLRAPSTQSRKPAVQQHVCVCLSKPRQFQALLHVSLATEQAPPLMTHPVPRRAARPKPKRATCRTTPCTVPQGRQSSPRLLERAVASAPRGVQCPILPRVSPARAHTWTAQVLRRTRH